jgi:hypothetical protein
MNPPLRCLHRRAERKGLAAPSILVMGFDELAWDALDTPARDDVLMVNPLGARSVSAGIHADPTRYA